MQLVGLHIQKSNLYIKANYVCKTSKISSTELILYRDCFPLSYTTIQNSTKCTDTFIFTFIPATAYFYTN
jgi:hypothetical protein